MDVITFINFYRAPALPRKKNLHSDKTSPRCFAAGKRQEPERDSRDAAQKISNADSFISEHGEDLPPPPLPRKPQIQDPLGAFNNDKNDQNKNNFTNNSNKQQPLGSKAINTSNLVVPGSSGDSSPPSSLSAESTNSDDRKMTNGNTTYLGAIPKRKNQIIANGTREELHGMAKHMKRNKNLR